jgi:hypothetical protein
VRRGVDISIVGFLSIELLNMTGGIVMRSQHCFHQQDNDMI